MVHWRTSTVEMVDLTEKQKELLRKTWALIEKDKEVAGISFFKDMFQTFPEYLAFFQGFNVPGGSGSLLANEKFVTDHIVGSVMKALDKLICNLDNPSATESVLKQLGKNHSKRNVTKQHFENVRMILGRTFKQYLSTNWNPEVEEAWKIFMEITFTNIYKGL